MTLGTSLCKWYFQGQAVDTAADLILEKSKVTSAFKTRAKVALIWLGISIVIAASFNPLVPAVAGFAMSALGLVPFVKPLFCCIKSLITERSSRFERFDDAIRAECADLRKQEDELRAKLNVVDDFVMANPELAASFSEAFAKDKQNIAGSLDIPPTIADDADLITRRTNLKLLVNGLEHNYLERVEFVERNPKFQACFLKHAMSRRAPARVAQIEVEADPVKSS